MTTLNADPCLAEALDYFNEIPLDDIFQKDFALVFDAGEVTPDVPSTTAYPAAFEQHTAHYHGQSLPMPIMSSHEVQPASVTSQTYTPAPATVTPNLPQKPVFSQQPIQSGEVSPATVATSVFEAPAQPKTAASTSSYNTSAPRKRSYSSMTIESTSAVAASATVTPIDDTSKLTFQQQKDLRR